VQHKSQECLYMFKAIVLGQCNSGKSCLLLRLTENNFVKCYISTIGIDFKVKLFNIKGCKVKLQAWDCSGQEKFRNVSQSYLQEASCVILVVDLTDGDSFSAVNEWLEEIENSDHYMVKVLIGTKCDLEGERAFPTEQILEFCEDYGFLYFETSAKEGTGVDAAFQEIVEQLLQQQHHKEKEQQMLQQSEQTEFSEFSEISEMPEDLKNHHPEGIQMENKQETKEKIVGGSTNKSRFSPPFPPN